MNKRDILRICYFFGYLILIGISLFGIGSLYFYLNSGADRANILHTSIKHSNNYVPQINWINNGHIGREIPNQTIAEIKEDYSIAWYENALANYTNLSKGLANHFTDSPKKYIAELLEYNKQNKISVKSTTIEHTIDVELFSEDGQLIVFNDLNALHYKRLFINDSLSRNLYETASYKVVMLLEDGYWKIRHLIKDDVSIQASIPTSINVDLSNIKGINYYPKKSAWSMFEKELDTLTISKDLTIIKAAKLNTVRIFIPYFSFGDAEVDTEKLQRVTSFLEIANTYQIKVIVTLFDFYGNYDVFDWTKTNKHLQTIVATFKDAPALFAWDVKNEPDLDFNSRGKNEVTEWLKFTIENLKKIDSITPVTIGWSTSEAASNLSNYVDFVSYHFYQDLNDFENQHQKLVSKINDKPILLQEFGLSSYSGFWNFYIGSANKQAKYHQKIQEKIGKLGLPFLSWTLYDFDSIPPTVISKKPWVINKQKNFGFIDVNGKKKKSFQFINHQ